MKTLKPAAVILLLTLSACGASRPTVPDVFQWTVTGACAYCDLFSGRKTPCAERSEGPEVEAPEPSPAEQSSP